MSADWRELEDVRLHFPRVAAIDPPDHIAFDFADEDLRVEMRVNCPLGLARILNVGPSATRTRKFR